MNAGKILVTGATGNVGSEVVRYASAAGERVVGAKRPGRNHDSLPGVEYVDFDFIDSATWDAAMDGVDRVFLMRPPHISNIRRDMAPFMNFMKCRDVRQVAFLSVHGADSNRRVPHFDVERTCISLGLPYTFLRPSFFMQNLTTTHLEEIRDGKTVFTPTGRGRTNFIDVRDIGEAAARVLREGGYVRKAYTITGEASYDSQEIAEHLSRGLDEAVRFADPGAIRFVVTSLRKGRGLKMTLVMLFLYSNVRNGGGDITTDDARRILGRPTRSLDEFIADHRAVLKGV